MTVQHNRREDSAETARYSLLLSGREAASLSRRRAEKLIRNGIKLFLFVSPEKASEFSTFRDAYGREFFNLFASSEALPSLRLTDGRFNP